MRIYLSSLKIFNLVVMKVPAMYLKRIWTPLEWLGISVFKDQEDGQYYYKKQGGNLKRIGKAV